MKNIILLVCLIVLLSGCATTRGPNVFQQEEAQIRQAYQNGELTYSEYLEHHNNIEQRRMQAVSAMLGYMNSNRPRTTTGTVTPAGGGAYRYRETSY